MNGIELWKKVAKVDPKFTKEVNAPGKPKFTNIDTYYLIQEATAEFGSMGHGFGLKDTTIEEVHLGEEILLKLSGTFWFDGGEFPIYNALKLMYKTSKGYVKVDEDAYKKIMTNTIAKALSYIGFGADVYMGKFEDAAYVNELMEEARRKENAAKPATMKKLKSLMVETATEEDKFVHFLNAQLKTTIEAIADVTEDEARVAIKALEEKKKRMTNADRSKENVA